MFTATETEHYDYSASDLQKVMRKSPQDLAESLEIMVVGARAIGETRVNLRGAICLLRDEPTQVSLENAVAGLQNMKGFWAKKRLEARVLICVRAIAQIEGKANAR